MEMRANKNAQTFVIPSIPWEVLWNALWDNSWDALWEGKVGQEKIHHIHDMILRITARIAAVRDHDTIWILRLLAARLRVEVEIESAMQLTEMEANLEGLSQLFESQF